MSAHSQVHSLLAPPAPPPHFRHPPPSDGHLAPARVSALVIRFVSFWMGTLFITSVEHTRDERTTCTPLPAPPHSRSVLENRQQQSYGKDSQQAGELLGVAVCPPVPQERLADFAAALEAPPGVAAPAAAAASALVCGVLRPTLSSPWHSGGGWRSYCAQ